mmetsp:Transcript_14506/g.28589  ORF Transcript_14506/g.28589 Transcript_14506/m.28589 type:complete len:110 (-) Transcript_14506:75-404(-)
MLCQAQFGAAQVHQGANAWMGTFVETQCHRRIVVRHETLASKDSDNPSTALPLAGDQFLSLASALLFYARGPESVNKIQLCVHYFRCMLIWCPDSRYFELQRLHMNARL